MQMKKWTELSPEEKREERFKRWLSPPDIKFSSAVAEIAYKERVTRLISTIRLEIPDRVPVIVPMGYYPIYYAGTTLQTVMYDYDELRRAWMTFLREFDTDVFDGPTVIHPGKALEILGYKLYKWPGHGLAPATSFYQFVEGEYMKADEYDALIKDPSNFSARIYMPRVFGALKPFQELPPFTSAMGMGFRFLTSYTMAGVQAAFQSLVDAGNEFTKWTKIVAECSKEAKEAGFPSFRGGATSAPFDTIGDAMRGTQGIIMDMYRQPDKLLEALEIITPLNIRAAIGAANASGVPLTFMPLHKGDDSFMSVKQYETFYWPTLKKVILGLVDEGITPLLFAEGSYMKRLEMIKDLPRGTVVWWFDKTDMGRAKEVLGDTACIAGNVPSSLLCTGTPGEVKEYCRKLIEVAGKGGGFILTGGAGVDRGNPDNLRALMEAGKEYGVYGVSDKYWL